MLKKSGFLIGAGLILLAVTVVSRWRSPVAPDLRLDEAAAPAAARKVLAKPAPFAVAPKNPSVPERSSVPPAAPTGTTRPGEVVQDTGPFRDPMDPAQTLSQEEGEPQDTGEYLDPDQVVPEVSGEGQDTGEPMDPMQEQSVPDEGVPQDTGEFIDPDGGSLESGEQAEQPAADTGPFLDPDLDPGRDSR